MMHVVKKYDNLTANILFLYNNIYIFPLFQFFTAHTRADETLALKQSLRSFHETKQSLQRVGLNKSKRQKDNVALLCMGQ